ncbi:MAG: S41 family peptidase [bacterium]|nr:S41 family peptidase [bacterium]
MEKQHRNGNRIVLFAALLIAVALVSSGVTAFLCTHTGAGGALQPLAQMKETIQRAFFYYDESANSDEKLVDAALRGMLSSIDDDYAQYYTAEQYAEHLKSNSGEYRGIGIVIAAPDETGSRIQRVYAGSPMAAAGAQQGDLVLSINGEPVAELSLDDMLALFHTDETADVLLLSRNGETFEVSVVKDIINVPYVEYALLEDGVGYIRLIGFAGHVVQETKDALANLTEQGAEKLVLDLRDNPGGSLDDVLDVADLFLERGQLIVSIRSRIEETETYYAKTDAVWNGPVVVLINENSASASELLSGAMQDHARATVVGTQSFGKGIVQTYFQLPANKGWVKLTTDAYYTPNDICIHGVGITPDVVVELPEEYRGAALESLMREQDTQLAAALDILKGN